MYGAPDIMRGRKYMAATWQAAAPVVAAGSGANRYKRRKQNDRRNTCATLLFLTRGQARVGFAAATS